MATHYHVASGITGYGPDGADGFACFDSLAGALDYARDELSTFADMAHEAAHGFAAEHAYADAWGEIERMEELETLRANLDPARASAPLYRDDPDAYAALQAEQLAGFPRLVSHNTGLYVWPCDEPDCEHCDDDA